MTEANSRRRLVVIGVIVMALFGGLLTRLWFLQVAGGEKLAVAAQQNRDRFVKVPAVRGTIYDAKGNVLAQTMPVTTLTVNRQQLSTTERATLEQNLGSLLGIDAATVDQRIDNQQYASYLPVPVAENIDLPTAVYVTEHRDLFPEVAVTRTAERFYPNNFQAADMLGYVGQINAEGARGAQGRRLPGQRHHRQVRPRADVRIRAARHARPRQGRGRQPGPRGERGGGEEAGRRPRRAAHRRPRSPAGRRGLPAQGMDGARSLVDDSGSHYAANAGAVVVLERADWLGGGAGVEPELRPQRLREGRRRPVLQRPATTH